MHQLSLALQLHAAQRLEHLGAVQPCRGLRVDQDRPARFLGVGLEPRRQIDRVADAGVGGA